MVAGNGKETGHKERTNKRHVGTVILCLVKATFAFMLADVGASFFFGNLTKVKEDWMEQLPSFVQENEDFQLITSGMMNSQYVMGGLISAFSALVFIGNVACAILNWRVDSTVTDKKITEVMVGADVLTAAFFGISAGFSVYCAQDLRRYPDDRMGLMDQFINSYLVTAALLANNSQDDLNLTSAHVFMSCCGFMSPDDFWHNDEPILLKNPPQTTITKLKISNEWLLKCALNRTENRTFCYAPTSCCRRAHINKTLDSNKAITCNAANIRVMDASVDDHTEKLQRALKIPDSYRKPTGGKPANDSDMYDVGCMPAFAMSVANRLMLFSIDACLLVIASLATVLTFIRLHKSPAKTAAVSPSKEKDKTD